MRDGSIEGMFLSFEKSLDYALAARGSVEISASKQGII